jgi:DNA-binding CsgD family transcriptional regulator
MCEESMMRALATPPCLISFLRPGATPSSAIPPSLHNAALLTLALDAMREGLVFFDLEERPVHANATVRRILAEQPDAEEIRREIRRFSESLGPLVRRGPPHDDGIQELAVRDFRTSEGSYVLRGSLVRMDAEGREGLLLVALEPAGPEFLSEELLQSRYNLTSREVRVARLVTLGLSDAEIATQLCISLHTARHHAEHLRQKLGVRSRGEVAAHVLRVGRGAAGAAPPRR